MEKKIPTTILEIGEDKLKVEVYQWLSQEEEDEYNSILIGSKAIETNTKAKELSFSVSYSDVLKANSYRLKTLLKSPSWDEVSQWSPDLRKELNDKVTEVIDKKK